MIRFAGQVESTYGYSQLAEFIEKQEEGFFKNLTVEDYTMWSGKVTTSGTTYTVYYCTGQSVNSFKLTGT